VAASLQLKRTFHVAGELKNGNGGGRERETEREGGTSGRYQQCLAKENTHTLSYKMAHVALPTKLI